LSGRVGLALALLILPFQPAFSTDFSSPGNPLLVLEALIQAYPDRVSELQIRKGDWSILINGETFYWAGGRLLPGSDLADVVKYAPYHFNSYPADLPVQQVLSPQELLALQGILKQRESHKDFRSEAFLKALWGMDDFLTAENTVVRVDFLGMNIRIHPEIKAVLKRVEDGICIAAETDEGVSSWLENITDSGAYVWRDIAGSANRSLHSYGIAIDLVPGDYHGKQAYWRWASDYYDEWWEIPYADRYQVPEPVVKVFEENGFIWGGKWMLFDQIHFEYRPELLLLGKPVESDSSL